MTQHRGAASASRARPARPRVGTDALSPSFAKLLPLAFPNAELVDGEVAMKAARRIKTPDEMAAIRVGACAVAEHGLAAAVAELAAGATEQALNGVLMEAMAAGGVSTPATQDGAWITSQDSPWRRAHGDGAVRDGRPGGLRGRSAGRRLRR